MKIKTLKIKITAANQDFDFTEFFTGNNAIYSTTAQLLQEEDGVYWHAFITYKRENGFELPKSYSKVSEEEEQALVDYEKELLQLIATSPNLNVRVKNAILSNINSLFYIKTIQNFKMFRNLGKKTILDNETFLNEVIALTKKYRENK